MIYKGVAGEDTDVGPGSAVVGWSWVVLAQLVPRDPLDEDWHEVPDRVAGEPLMSLCHHRTHLLLLDLRELFTESFDDLIQLPNLMGSSGVRHDVIMTGRRASPAQSLSEPGQG